MGRLVTLALAETTEKGGYALFARSIDTDEWVLVKELPVKEFTNSKGEPVWDIFGVTRGELTQKDGRARPEEAHIRNSPRPYLDGYIDNIVARLSFLEGIAVDGVREGVYESPNYIGVVRVDKVIDISSNYRHTERSSFDEQNPFYTVCRIHFIDADGEKWDAPCKDIRWKTYWIEKGVKDAGNSKQRWLKYLNDNETFFLVEVYPPWRGVGVFGDDSGHYFAVSGILSLPGGLSE